MPRSLHVDTSAALQNDHLKWLVLIELFLDSTTIRLCTRFKQFTYNSEIYTGIGSIGEVDPVEESMALDPTSCYLRLSGIDPTFLSTIANSDLLNRDVLIRYALLDDNNAVIGEPIVHFEGSMDMPEITYGKNAVIEIQAKGSLADWDRERPERLTYEEQLSRYPLDHGLEFIASIGSRTIVWPSKGYKG